MRVIEPAVVELEAVRNLYGLDRTSTMQSLELLRETPLAYIPLGREAPPLAGYALALDHVEEARRLARLGARVMAATFELAAVEKALTRHRDYWAREPLDIEALLPGLLLGAVRWGDQLGVRRTVDSPLFRVLPPLENRA